MNSIYYNENTSDLEIPLDILSRYILYCKKKLHNIKIVSPIKKNNDKLDLSPLTENDNIHSLHIIIIIDLKKLTYRHYMK